jgi:hypothetical protein
MANLYGYNDYNGPLSAGKLHSKTVYPEEGDSDVEEDHDPLRVGMWMEGDSLAPPCGTSIPTIHRLLEFASISSTDVLYDLGCGDGRICLEALVCGCGVQCCVGIDIESDLIERFQFLIDEMPESYTRCTITKRKRISAIHADLRGVLNHLVARFDKTFQCNPEIDDVMKELPNPTVLVLYLLPESIRELEPALLKLLSHVENLKIICNTWGLNFPKPANVFHVSEPNSGATSKFLLYDNSVVDNQSISNAN